MKLTDLCYELRGYNFEEHDIKISFVDNHILFLEEKIPSPKTFHKLKVILSLNNIGFQVTDRTFNNYGLNKKVVLHTLKICKGLEYNPLSFINEIKESGFVFKLKSNNFHMRLRYCFLKDSHLQVENLDDLKSSINVITEIVERHFSNYNIFINTTYRPATYIDIIL